MKEQDLYQPIKNLFESKGYEVFGEVNSIDVIAKSDDTLIAIELKKTFSLHLIAQGAQRHKLTDFVYIAIPTPSKRIQRGEAFRDKLYLIGRLGLGLIFVDTSKSTYKASIQREPSLTDIKTTQTRNKKKRTAVLKEIKNRHSNLNIGGSKGKTITAYRESALRILYYLRDAQPHSTKELREMTNNPKATRILYDNHYGWYKNISKGYYEATSNGLLALKEYEHLIDCLIH